MATYFEQRFDHAAEQYWNGVRLTLVEVFGAPGDLAVEYRRDVDNAPSRVRLLAYHATPLQVAADLTLTDVLTNEHLEAYRKRVIPVLDDVIEWGVVDTFREDRLPRGVDLTPEAKMSLQRTIIEEVISEKRSREASPSGLMSRLWNAIRRR